MFALVATIAAAGAAAAADGPGRGKDSADHRKWQRVWSDEFSGPAGAAPDPSKWKHEVGGHGWGNQMLQTYTARRDNSRLDGDGHLEIVARRERHTGPDLITREYTSARLTTEDLFSVRYGRVAARVKVPRGRGLWSIFWMLGADFDEVSWPRCGEVDILELRGQQPRWHVWAVHGPDRDGKHVTVRSFHRVKRSLANRFHVFAITWRRNYIRFELDGRPYGLVQRKRYPGKGRWVYNRPMFLLLDLGVGGTFPGSPDETTPFPATMETDWVRVWKRAR
jgi:beta-glucanase (GH16 family)